VGEPRGFLVADEQDGWRLDKVLAAHPSVGSRGRARQAVETGKVSLDGEVCGLEQVSASTRIPRDKLMAIEGNDPSAFAAPVYLRGFVRQFARHLGLDGDRVVRIDEKPENPTSNLAVGGVYMYDSAVFDIIKTLKPSKRGELEITDVNNAYIARGEMTYDVVKGWWADAGTFPAL